MHVYLPHTTTGAEDHRIALTTNAAVHNLRLHLDWGPISAPTAVHTAAATCRICHLWFLLTTRLLPTWRYAFIGLPAMEDLLAVVKGTGLS